MFPESCCTVLRCPVSWRETHKAGRKAELGNACRRDKEIRGAAGEGALQVAQKQKLGILSLRDAAITRLPAEFEGKIFEFLSVFSLVEILGEKTLDPPCLFVSW